MIVAACEHEKTKKHGKDYKGNPRRRCCTCGKTFIDKPETAYGNLRITDREAATALGMLLEGMAIRSVERLTGLHRDTLCDLVLRVGEKCERFLSATVVDVKAEDIQCDEIWSFVGCKEKHRVSEGYTPDFGDSWTFIAVERTTKLVLAYEIGDRDHYTTRSFLHKVSNATTGHFQISTDGGNYYTNMVPFIFGSRCDFGQLIKNYRSSQSVVRYSPATIISSEKKAVYGCPDRKRICTSHVERLNLSLRMQVRRFTRLTNAYSKSVKHHAAMQAIFFAAYNFCRKHDSLKMTPAQASGLADKQWTILDLLERVA
jgi:IS1 family transposase/transposase-like protein